MLYYSPAHLLCFIYGFRGVITFRLFVCLFFFKAQKCVNHVLLDIKYFFIVCLFVWLVVIIIIFGLFLFLVFVGVVVFAGSFKGYPLHFKGS